MKKFKDYSLPELYGNINQGPQNPAEINWKSVAIYGGLAIGTAIVFAVVINYGMGNQSQQWRLQAEKMNQQYFDTIERQGAIIQKLTTQLSVSFKQQTQEREVQKETSVKV